MGTSKPRLVTVPDRGVGLVSTSKLKENIPFGAARESATSEPENWPDASTATILLALAIPHAATDMERSNSVFINMR
jgi:hypothetical protein